MRYPPSLLRMRVFSSFALPSPKLENTFMSNDRNTSSIKQFKERVRGEANKLFDEMGLNNSFESFFSLVVLELFFWPSIFDS